MKIALIRIVSSKDSWYEDAVETYSRKLSGLATFELITLKSKNFERDQKDKKIELEADLILKALQERDNLIVFDEKGQEYDSPKMAKKLESVWTQSGRRLVFLIGGAYGVSETVKKRATSSIRLSNMTMNHQVAAVVAMEQIYRSLTILKGIPYHNV